MELQIYNPTNNQPLQPIEWNFEDLKTWLAESLQSYHGVIFADVQEAKAERAKLNKLKDAIDGKRIEMKKKYLEPYNTFETQCKELTGMIAQVTGEIDKQVKATEEAEKQKKLEEIRAYYYQVIGTNEKMVPYESLHDPKWLNKSTSMKSIKDEIDAKLNKFAVDMQTIDTTVPEQMKPRILAKYLETRDLGVALCLKVKIEEEERRAEEFKRQQEERRLQEQARREDENRKREEERQAALEKLRQAEAENSQNEQVTHAERPTAQEAPEKPAEAKTEPQEPETVQIDFRVWATREQLQALKTFLVTNGIKYGKVQ